MTVRVDLGWKYRGLEIVRVENSRLSLDVLPELGGRVLSLVDKRHDRNVIWRHPRIDPHRSPLHGSFDDHFSGGWDDAFPTCAPCQNEYGDDIPYLGEIWNLPLTVSVEDAGPDVVRVRLEGQTPITPARWSKTLTLTEGSPSVRMETAVENIGTLPFNFTCGTHAAVAVDPGDRIDAPARRALVAEAGGGSLGQVSDRYDYPHLKVDEREVDIREVRERELGAFGLHMFPEIERGWIAVTNAATRSGFGLAFDPSVLTSAWQWMNYGGFRGVHHAIIEAWTGPALSLSEAAAAGNARRLAPDERFSTVVHGVLYDGVDSVQGLSADGEVR